MSTISRFSISSVLHRSGLCFLSAQAEHDFNWAIKALHSLFEGHGIRFPRIIITDRQIALMNALKTYFPTSHHLICRWHFNKCVPAKARGSIHKQVKHTDAEGKEEFFDHTDTVNFMQPFYRCIDIDDVDAPKGWIRYRLPCHAWVFWEELVAIEGEACKMLYQPVYALWGAVLVKSWGPACSS